MPTKEFFVYTWGVKDMDTKSWMQSETIYIYGIDKNNKSVCCTINNFRPFVHIELPENINWTEKINGRTKVSILGSELRTLLGCLASVQNESKFQLKNKLYGYTICETANDDKGEDISFDKDMLNIRKRYPYLILRFKNIKQIYNLRSKLSKKIFINGIGELKLNVRECPSSPLVQFMAEYNIPATGWIKISSKFLNPTKLISRCDNEYEIDCDMIKNNNTKIYAVDSIIPVNPIIMSWDIEVFSYNGLFPKPEHPLNCVFQISCVFSGIQESYKKILLTLGQVADIQDVTVQCFKTEWELLEGFANIINEYKPNCMIGWNISGFDISYIISRANLHHCTPNMTNFGMIKNCVAKEKKINWQSKAYGTTNLTTLVAEGILSLDIMDIVQKSYKLDSYSLNSVASHFLELKKDDVSPEYMWDAYRNCKLDPTNKKSIISMTKVGKYCIKDSELVLDIFENLQMWNSLTEMSKTCYTTCMDIHTRGQQIRFFNQLYRYCYNNKTVVDKEDIQYTLDNKEDATERYRGATVQDPIPGMYENVIPLDFSSLYPSIMIAYNLDYSTFISESDYEFLKHKYPKKIDEICHVMEWEDHILCEHDPQVLERNSLTHSIEKCKNILGFYSQTIKKLRKVHQDLKSPNYDIRVWIQLIQNIEYIPYDIRCNFNVLIPKDCKTWLDIKAHMKQLQQTRSSVVKKLGTSGMICASRRYIFIKSDIYKGAIPTIIQNLLDARKQVRRQIAELVAEKSVSKNIKELESKIAILEQRQLSYKICANSMYGATGVKSGSLPFMPIAMCTTYQGRLCVAKAEYLVTNKYGGKVIYKDTDSNYVIFDNNMSNMLNVQTLWDYAMSVASNVSKEFLSPISLEFENAIYYKFLILTKKRYMYYSCDQNGTIVKDKFGNPKLGKRGVIISRRDNSYFMKEVYTKFITSLFSSYPKIDMEYMYYNIIKSILRLFYNQISINDLIITKTVNDYKEDEYIATKTFTPSLGKNDKGEDKWKIGNYCIQNHIPPTTFKTDEQIGKFYLEQLPAQVQLRAKMCERGDIPTEGQRISFIVCSTLYNHYTGKNLKISQKIESPEYVCKYRSLFYIDYLYYIERLIEPIDQILAVLDDKQHNKHIQPYNKKFIINFPKLVKIFETRVASKNTFTKQIYKTCMNKQAVIKEIYNLSRPVILVEN
jgi:DNA polymerase elongation subunit (family B)